MPIKLSILVLSVPNRVNSFFPKLMLDLQEQTKDRKDVEILGLYDNKISTVGEKRQNLLNIAKGDYIVFIDDDDRIAPDYVKEIMNVLTKNPQVDCVVFDVMCTLNNKKQIIRKYGVELDYWISDDEKNSSGKPSHIMVYKKSIAERHKFPFINRGEDVEWTKRVCKHVKKQIRINKVLYYYDFNSRVSETQLIKKLN